MSASPRRSSQPRATPGTHGGRPDPRRPVPRPKDPRGVRLHLPALDQEAGDRASRPARLPARQGEHRAPRTTRDRQDTPAIALGIRACLAGQRVIFRTATEWVALLADAQRQGRLEDELKRLERIPLLICDVCRISRLCRHRRCGRAERRVFAGFFAGFAGRRVGIVSRPD